MAAQIFKRLIILGFNLLKSLIKRSATLSGTCSTEMASKFAIQQRTVLYQNRKGPFHINILNIE